MTGQPTATALKVTQQQRGDDSRSLHFTTDQGPVVVRCDDPDHLYTRADLLTDEADDWTNHDIEGARP
jgi:hypothetical protein